MGTVNFHRGPLPTDGYTIITNDEARGDLPVPLKAPARCLWLYFKSLPDGWKLDRDQLDRSFVEGKDMVTTGIRELKAKGYLKQERRQSRPGGRWEWSWYFTDNPLERSLEVRPASSSASGASPKGSPSTENPLMGATCGNAANLQVIPSAGSPSIGNSPISTEDGLPQKTEKKTSAGAAPDSAGAAPPLRVGGPATANNADPWGRPQTPREQPAHRDSRTWRQLLDDDDRDTIMERIAGEVDGVDGGEETMAESMLDRGCHPKMIINTIMAERGTPNSPVTAAVQRFAQFADTQVAAHGRQWTHGYRQRLAGAIRECVNEGWTDDRLIRAIQAEVDRALELVERQRDPWGVPA